MKKHWANSHHPKQTLVILFLFLQMVTTSGCVAALLAGAAGGTAGTV